MASIILKKRKLSEAIDQDLQIKPSSLEMKKRIDERGEYKQLYESILPQLKVLFPNHQDSYLLETLKSCNNDIITTIEYLKCHKIQSPIRTVAQHAGDVDENIVNVVDQLYRCQSREHAYEILTQFKNHVIDSDYKNKQKIVAENQVLRKAFKIQKKILIEEELKRKETEQILVNLAKELESSKSLNKYLVMKLNQMEMKCNSNAWNNHIC